MKSNLLTKSARKHSDATLFNRCANWREPRWSKFRQLGVGGGKLIYNGNGVSATTRLVSDHDAEFWTVYGRTHDGEAHAITDCRSREGAQDVAYELSCISGLSVISSQVRPGLNPVPATNYDEPLPAEFHYEPAANLAALLMLADYSRYVFWLCVVGIVLCLQWWAIDNFRLN
jgi:hypothetical protein